MRRRTGLKVTTEGVSTEGIERDQMTSTASMTTFDSRVALYIYLKKSGKKKSSTIVMC